MREEQDRYLALECLKIARGDVGHAREMLAFVLGDEPVVSGSESEPLQINLP